MVGLDGAAMFLRGDAMIFYQSLRGKVHAFAPAPKNEDGSVNPHLWVVLEAAGHLWFATINVRSDKEPVGAPVGHSYLYYVVDTDFTHPIVPSILARPEGLSPAHGTIERSYQAGALDYQRGNLFDPNAMRVLPPEGEGDDGLVQRLSGLLQLARQQNDDVIIFGQTFKMQKPHQTDGAFGYTPDGPFGMHNIHMAQGDKPDLFPHGDETGLWGDGGCFLWDGASHRMTAVFLAFQSQKWHTDDHGVPVEGVTVDEPPTYDFSSGTGVVVQPPVRALEITSLHRLPDGSSNAVVANMTGQPLDMTGWSLLADVERRQALPSQPLAAGTALPITLPTGFVKDSGGILTLLNPENLRVDGVAFTGGNPAVGWSDSFR